MDPIVDPSTESYLEQERRKLEAELAYGEFLQTVPLSIRRLGPELETLGGLTPCQRGVVWALAEVRFLSQLVAAKFQGPHVVVEHQEATETYQMLRQNLLMNLGEAELADWQTWAEGAVPVLLNDLVAGDRAWGRMGVARLEEVLMGLVEADKLYRQVEAVDRLYRKQGVGGAIRDLDQATRQANELEDARRLAVSELEREQVTAEPVPDSEPEGEIPPAEEAIVGDSAPLDVTAVAHKERGGGPPPKDWLKKRAQIKEHLRDLIERNRHVPTLAVYLEHRGTKPRTWDDWMKKMTNAGIKTNWGILLEEIKQEARD